ncbi:hypothetical protein M426DRAFT_154851 [Hypoxylon sp. CI-4A]|nr:hypothetical protein M426DRAFT_154851 [Hypoxylon sp. CI-4A]
MRARRTHRKSRNGCIGCKQRHIKCDETLPSCINCSTSDRTCSFVSSRPRRHADAYPPTPSVSAPSISSTASSPIYLLSETGTLDSNNSSTSFQSTLVTPGQINIQHLVLLRHLEHEVLKSPYLVLPTDVQDAQLRYEAIFKSAVSAPYLMHELLAFSALHYSMHSSDGLKKKEYAHLAAELQTSALALFNATKPEVHNENCMTLLVFSSLLGMHTLFDAVASYNDIPDLLDKIVHYLKVHHGVRAITNQSWHVLRDSEILHRINSIEASDEACPQKEKPANECDRLLSLLDSWCDKLSPGTYNTCLEAIRSLSWGFNLYSSLSSPDSLHITMAWPVMISAEFIELLDQRQPVPLIVLAHWAMLLHFEREFWVFNGAGRIIIESLSRHLGPYWDDWLTAPKEALDGS